MHTEAVYGTPKQNNDAFPTCNTDVLQPATISHPTASPDSLRATVECCPLHPGQHTTAKPNQHITSRHCKFALPQPCFQKRNLLRSIPRGDSALRRTHQQRSPIPDPKQTTRHKHIVPANFADGRQHPCSSHDNATTAATTRTNRPRRSFSRRIHVATPLLFHPLIPLAATNTHPQTHAPGVPLYRSCNTFEHTQRIELSRILDSAQHY